jgi:hypothetical protein
MNEHRSPNEQSVFIGMRRQIAMTPLPERSRSLRQRTRSPRLIAGSFGVLAAVFAASLVTGVFSSAPPAFAVTTTADTVTITLNDAGALDALNAKLAAENIPIRDVSIVPGCTATAQTVGADGEAGPPQTIEASSSRGPSGSMTIEINQQPAPGDTLIVALSSDGRGHLFPHEISGPVPRCIGDATPVAGHLAP